MGQHDILLWHLDKRRKRRYFSAAPILAAILTLPVWGAPQTSYKFDFGGKAAPGYSHVAANALYSNDVGYGFEVGPAVSEVDRGGSDPLRDGFVTDNQPFFFSAEVPEGNYRVTVTLGDPDGDSVTTVKAELRRLMLEKVQTAHGQVETRTFIVNVRQPEFPGGRVKFKPRETTSEKWAWDDKLTLEFSNAVPKLCALTIEKVDDLPTIYIAGDSTSTDQPLEPYNSWGQMLTRFFKPVIAIANNGESGESARSFIGEKRWPKVMSVIKPGDYVFIQFGHNDQKEKGEGVGAYTTYKATLKQFVDDTRQHGATPVLITPMNRRTFDANGQITNSLGDFPDAVRQLAKEEHVALIDLNAMSKTLYEALGPDESGVLFAGKDTTHHSDYGSYELARCIVLGIQQDKLPIAQDLVDDLPRFDPAHPDPIGRFDVPPDPNYTSRKPYGN